MESGFKCFNFAGLHLLVADPSPVLDLAVSTAAPVPIPLAVKQPIGKYKKYLICFISHFHKHVVNRTGFAFVYTS